MGMREKSVLNDIFSGEQGVKMGVRGMWNGYLERKKVRDFWGVKIAAMGKWGSREMGACRGSLCREKWVFCEWYRGILGRRNSGYGEVGKLRKGRLSGKLV